MRRGGWKSFAVLDDRGAAGDGSAAP